MATLEKKSSDAKKSRRDYLLSLKQGKKSNEIKKAFGALKDLKMDIETIREKAWR